MTATLGVSRLDRALESEHLISDRVSAFGAWT
jgi:hypothetical protein